ncbi:MAG: DUF4231 domain-containing protein [Candidatus Ornithomonoglobus sp.]
MEDKLVQAIEKKIESSTDDNRDEDFILIFKAVADDVGKKAAKNKKAYFRIQNIIILLGAVVAVVNIIITLVSAKEEWSYIVPFLSGVASALTILSTTLMKKRDFKKYFETWMRHSSNQFKLRTESTAYLFGVAEYANLDGADALKMFKERWLEIEKSNYEKFMENMNKFETDLGEETKNG